jgi:hypothetical protein
LTTGGSGGGTTGLRGDDGAGISNSISASAPAVGEEDTCFERKKMVDTCCYFTNLQY